MRKPKAVIIMRPFASAEDFDTERDGMAAILRYELGLDTLVYDSVFRLKDDIDEGKCSLDDFALIAVESFGFRDLQELGDLSQVGLCVFSSRYDQDFDGKSFSDKATVLEDLLYSKDKVIELAKNEMQRFIQREKKKKVCEEVQMLEWAYRYNYSGENEDEGVLGISGSIDDMVVAEYIRCRLLPGSEVKKEFDEALPKIKAGFDGSREDYLRTLQRVKGLSPEERKDLVLRMNNKQGSITMGEEVSGFSIDTETLEKLQTSEYGFHRTTHLFLAERIALLEEHRREESVSKEDVMPRIVSGFVYGRIMDVPVLKLWPWDHSNENLRKIGAYLINQGKMIPVDVDGKLVDENYEKPLK